VSLQVRTKGKVVIESVHGGRERMSTGVRREERGEEGSEGAIKGQAEGMQDEEGQDRVRCGRSARRKVSMTKNEGEGRERG